jgi:NitT/TauT family transport system permease protein
MDSALAWAALVWLSALGIILFVVVVAVEKLVMPWAETSYS